MATHTTHSEPLQLLLPSPWLPEMGRGARLGRGRGHSPTTETACGPPGNFYLLPMVPSQLLQAQPRDVPQTTHTFSTADCFHINFLDTTTPLRDPCGSVAATSAILSFASDAHVVGAVLSLLPLSPERCRTELNLRALQTQAPIFLLPAPTLIKVISFNKHLFSV